jgi:hypothetical protein
MLTRGRLAVHCCLLLGLCCLGGCISAPWQTRPKTERAGKKQEKSKASDNQDGEEMSELSQDSRRSVWVERRPVEEEAESAPPPRRTPAPASEGIPLAASKTPLRVQSSIQQTKYEERPAPDRDPRLTAEQPGSPYPVTDPHQRMAPTASGSLLNLPPGEGPMERAVELTRQLQMIQSEKRLLAEQLRHEQEAAQGRDRLLSEATRDIKDATTEVESTRGAMRDATEELKQQRVRLSVMENDVVETLKSVVTLLEKLEGRDRSAEYPVPRP